MKWILIKLLGLALVVGGIFAPNARAAQITDGSYNELFSKSSSTVVYFISEAAKIYGVDPTTALFIAEHESQYGWQYGNFNPAIEGDAGISIGIWQFNVKANPAISRQCASDIVCSTITAMEWLKSGKENKWSTWRFRCDLYGVDCKNLASL